MAAPVVPQEVCESLRILPENIEHLLSTHVRAATTLPMDKFLGETITQERYHLLTSWMFQVTEGLQCDKAVFPSAVEFLHGFLSHTPVTLARLQLAGATSLFLSSKLHESNPIHSSSLCFASANLFNSQDVKDCESSMLEALEWRLHAHCSPHDLVAAFLALVSPELLNDAPYLEAVDDVMTMCYTDLGLFGYGSALIALASAYVVLAETQESRDPLVPALFPLYQKTFLELLPVIVKHLSPDKTELLFNCIVDVQGAWLANSIAQQEVKRAEDEGVAPSPFRQGASLNPDHHFAALPHPQDPLVEGRPEPLSSTPATSSSTSH